MNGSKPPDQDIAVIYGLRLLRFDSNDADRPDARTSCLVRIKSVLFMHTRSTGIHERRLAGEFQSLKSAPAVHSRSSNGIGESLAVGS